MATVMPHAVLFRAGGEGKIRRKLVDHDHIEAIISVLPQLFYNTGIPTCILVLRPKVEKPPKHAGKILFINADREFDQVSDRAMNLMLEKSARTQGRANAAWRRAVETTLQQLEIITICQPKSVTQFP